MAKTIYALKIWLFQKQFRIITREERALHSIFIFVVVVYLKALFTESFAASSASIQLHTVLATTQWVWKRKYDPRLCCSKEIWWPLWYQSKELIGVAFFDEDVFLQTKREMVLAINEKSTKVSSEDGHESIGTFDGSWVCDTWVCYRYGICMISSMV